MCFENIYRKVKFQRTLVSVHTWQSVHIRYGVLQNIKKSRQRMTTKGILIPNYFLFRYHNTWLKEIEDLIHVRKVLVHQDLIAILLNIISHSTDFIIEWPPGPFRSRGSYRPRLLCHSRCIKKSHHPKCSNT